MVEVFGGLRTYVWALHGIQSTAPCWFYYLLFGQIQGRVRTSAHIFQEAGYFISVLSIMPNIGIFSRRLQVPRQR